MAGEARPSRGRRQVRDRCWRGAVPDTLERMKAPLDDQLPDRLLAGVAEALARSVGLSLGSGLERSLGLAVKAAASELGLSPVALATAAAAGRPEALEVLAEHAVVGETSLWRHGEGLVALAGLLAATARP